MNGIFDTHAHYDDEAFSQDREELLEQLKQEGIETVVDVGASLESTQKAIELAEAYPFIYGAAGVHPNETGCLTEEDMKWLKGCLSHPKVVAVGEIGLDYHWDEPERDVQKRWFLRQMELAKEADMPVIIHSRDAAKDTLDLIRQAGGKDMDMVIHCFSYGVDMAREYLNMGHFIGIGGVLTFKNARKLKEVAAFAPLEQILLETDCPYLSPEPNRGKRNSSLNLPYVVQALAQIKQVKEEEVVEQTRKNARRFYRLS